MPDPKPHGRVSAGVEAWVQAEKYIQIALVLPCGALIGWAIGAWLDSRLHQPWITVAGLVVGIVAGLSAAVRMAISFTGGAQDGGVDAGADGKDGGGPE